MFMTEFARRSAPVSRRPSAADASSPDNRFAPRRQDFLPATLQFEGTTFTTPCVVRDMSTTGARIELKAGWDKPLAAYDTSEQVQLVLRQDRVMYPCRIIRRSATELGVKFTGAPKPGQRIEKKKAVIPRKSVLDTLLRGR
jgi:hypothetical protein